MAQHPIRTIFLDVGGVIATNGWDHGIRKKVADFFNIDYSAMESRHTLVFPIYETGKMTLDEYLDWTVFNQKRSFTKDEFKQKMYEQSQPDVQMLDFAHKLKTLCGIKLIILSNEGRELAEYRVRKLQLKDLSDTLIFSAFVHIRKPDKEIYRLALDLSQTPVSQVLYIDDRPFFVEVAKSLGIQGIPHENFESTVSSFAEFGIHLPSEHLSSR